MKYIRTENGIEKLDADREHLAEYMNGKQADTIEELCDEFIGILPNERPYFQLYKLLHTFDDIKYNYLNVLKVEPKLECYAAIWTDKGLIYVAKMNKKGELELL